MDLFLEYFLPKLLKVVPEQSALIESIASGYKICNSGGISIINEIKNNPHKFYFRGFEGSELKQEINDFFYTDEDGKQYGLWMSPYFDTACKYASSYTVNGKIAVIEIDEDKLNPISLDELDEICEPIDASAYLNEIRDAGYNAAYNYIDSEEGICIFDPTIVKRIEILDTDAIKILYDYFDVGQDADSAIIDWRESI